MDIKKSLGLFRDLLNVSWPTFLVFEEAFADDAFNDFRINWLQANWEMTVEQSVLQGPHFLQTYGDGADFGGTSCRVSFSDALPTHHIVCRPKVDGILLTPITDRPNSHFDLDLIVFERFVRMTEAGWYEEAPPFDCVLADYRDTQIIFKFAEAEFSLEQITS